MDKMAYAMKLVINTIVDLRVLKLAPNPTPSLILFKLIRIVREIGDTVHFVCVSLLVYYRFDFFLSDAVVSEIDVLTDNQIPNKDDNPCH